MFFTILSFFVIKTDSSDVIAFEDSHHSTCYEQWKQLLDNS